MTDKRVTGQESLDDDDFVQDGRDLSFGYEDAGHYSSPLEDVTVSEFLYARHQKIKRTLGSFVSASLPNAEDLDSFWHDTSDFYLFDLPAYATHSDPQVARTLGQKFDVNDQYNISCQVWDRDPWGNDEIGTASYGDGLFIDPETGKTIPEWNSHVSVFEMAVTQNPNPECIKELIAAGGWAKNTDVLLLAVKYNNPQVVKALIEAGANVNDVAGLGGRFPEGTTPIQLALERGHGGMFELLANSGAKYYKMDVKEIISQEKEERFVSGLTPEMRAHLGYYSSIIGVTGKSVSQQASGVSSRLAQNSEKPVDTQQTSLKDRSR